jgi:threonylcarbamoyladenosine tRNA methylthiotransferase MtaB
LKLMNRRYLSGLYRDRVTTIKKLMPDCCIGVDVITGFPGESDEEFKKTYEFLNELDISYLHVFTYSERANTKAVDMVNAIPLNIRTNRSKMLRTLSEKKKRFFYESQVGKQGSVLFEDDVHDGVMEGFTSNYIRVKAKYDPVLINELKEIVMVAVDENTLMEIVEKEEILSHN